MPLLSLCYVDLVGIPLLRARSRSHNPLGRSVLTRYRRRLPDLPFYSSFGHELVVGLAQQPAHIAGHFITGKLPARLDELGVLADYNLSDDTPCVGPLIEQLFQHAL